MTLHAPRSEFNEFYKSDEPEPHPCKFQLRCIGSIHAWISSRQMIESPRRARPKSGRQQKPHQRTPSRLTTYLSSLIALTQPSAPPIVTDEPGGITPPAVYRSLYRAVSTMPVDGCVHSMDFAPAWPRLLWPPASRGERVGISKGQDEQPEERG